MRLILSVLVYLALSGSGLASNPTGPGKVDFARDVYPLLQRTCFECHGPEKQKGSLRLDSRAALLEGGDFGPPIVPGKPDESELLRRVALPKGTDGVMPARGEPLSKEQIGILREWVNGTQVTNVTDLNDTQSLAPAGYSSFDFVPTYGGGFNPVPAEQWFRVDDIEVFTRQPFWRQQAREGHGQKVSLLVQPKWINNWLVEKFAKWREGGPAMETEVQANLQSSALVFGAIESARSGAPLRVQDFIKSFG